MAVCLSPKLRETKSPMFSQIEATNIAGMTDEEIRDEMRKRLLGVMVNNGNCQRVIPLGDVEKYLGEGWEYVAPLSNERAIVRMPT